jgi:hypothetical protein
MNFSPPHPHGSRPPNIVTLKTFKRIQEPESRIQEKGNQNSFLLIFWLFEPQNIEQGMSNVEVITSSFCGYLFCGSIFIIAPLAFNAIRHQLCALPLLDWTR